MSHWDVDLDDHFEDSSRGKVAAFVILQFVFVILILIAIVSCVAIGVFGV